MEASGRDALDFPEAEGNRALIARAKRLREAVDEAGRNKAVALRAGIPVGTLNNYLKGRDMKASALVALAAACKVSLDWLATGTGRKLPEWHVPAMSGPPVGTNLPDGGQVVQGPAQPLMHRSNDQDDDPRRIMFTEANVKELTEALEAAEAIIDMRGAEPSTRGKVQLMLLLRDHTYKARHDKDEPA